MVFGAILDSSSLFLGLGGLQCPEAYQLATEAAKMDFALYLASPYHCIQGMFSRRKMLLLSTTFVAFVVYVGTMLPFPCEKEYVENDGFADGFVGVMVAVLWIPVWFVDPIALGWYWRMGDLAREIRNVCVDSEEEKGGIPAME
jgi:hypothetical protein